MKSNNSDRYKHVFFDLDRTLWDFDSSALITFKEIYAKYKLSSIGVKSVAEFLKVYNFHNDELWIEYREGKLTKEKLRGLRFHLTLKDFGIVDNKLAEAIGNDYIAISPLRVSLFPNAVETLEYLQPDYQLHMITNGFSEVQTTKLKSSGLGLFFNKIITSEEAGHKKPDRRIFEFAMGKTTAEPDTSIMIGDDPEVDIVGAKNFGMDQVLFDPERKYSKNGSTFYINDLIELRNIL